MTDVEGALNGLVGAGLLWDRRWLEDLETILGLLPSNEVKALAKCMNLNKVNNKANKCENIAELVKHSKKKSNFFFSNVKNPIEVKLRKMAEKKLPGNCFKMDETARKIFMRILSLFSLSNFWEERESDKGQGQAQQLTTVLLVNQGKLTYPLYDIRRERKIFRDRRDLLAFEEACGLEADMTSAFEVKDWVKAAEEVTPKALALFDRVLDEDGAHAGSLPRFLRRFTRGAVLAYVLSKAVEVFERLREYDKAVDLIRRLLKQDLYLPDYRGRWYERLTLDLDQHLKDPRGCLNEVINGLDDAEVMVARRLFLCQRAEKICTAKKNTSLKGELRELSGRSDWIRTPDTPNTALEGRLMPKEDNRGKTVFVFETGHGEELLCSVEEYVKVLNRFNTVQFSF